MHVTMTQSPGHIFATKAHFLTQKSFPKNAVWDGCRSVSYKWVDWMDGWKSPGGVKYRAAYAANELQRAG